MKKIILCLTLALLTFTGLFAQPLPVREVTIYKNGKSLIHKYGKVPVQNKKYVSRDLPKALFGTFWVGSAVDELQSVFTCVDSVETASKLVTKMDLLEKYKDKPVTIYMPDEHTSNIRAFEAQFVYKLPPVRDDYYTQLLFRMKDGTYRMIHANHILSIGFGDMPFIDFKTKKASERMELTFRTDKREQEVSMLYLTDSLGWTPVYRLDLESKDKGKLALRAEIANNAEDLGDTELRLAVGVPNFSFANQPSLLVDFKNFMIQYQNNQRYIAGAQRLLSNYISSQSAYSPSPQDDDRGGEEPEGSRAEDFYFYSIRPGAFPKFSRYQFPVLEAEVAPAHFYECALFVNRPDQYYQYSAQNQPRGDDAFPVTHYIEFKNKTAQPWTTGVVNVLSRAGADLQPVSQDMLPYTPPGGTCKVRIAQSPDIEVTHVEGVTDRKENAKNYFSRTYDLISAEGQICAFNYKKEPIKLKIRRPLEGKPLQSDQPWNLTQEQASLRVNSTYVIEWEIELKPGEERKWKYSYEILVNL